MRIIEQAFWELDAPMSSEYGGEMLSTCAPAASKKRPFVGFRRL